MVDNIHEEPDWGPAPDNCVEGSSSSGVSEPDWTTPQEAIPECGAFVSAGPSPFKLTGAMLRLLQYHFSDPNNIENPQLKDLIWTTSTGGCEDEIVVDNCGTPTGEIIPGSNLLIAPSYKRDGLAIQQRPAIFVRREAVSTRKVNPVTQNQAIPHLSRPGNQFEGALHNVFLNGKHTLIAMAQYGSAAEAIAEEVYFRMLNYMTVIKNDFNLGAFFVDSIGDVREYKEEAKTAFYCAVQVSWSYNYRWRVIQESPIIKRMAIIPVDRT